VDVASFRSWRCCSPAALRRHIGVLEARQPAADHRGVQHYLAPDGTSGAGPSPLALGGAKRELPSCS
jgi:hypothetical protein